MTTKTFYPTTEKLISENYPYGYKLKTTKTDFLEFSPKQGFRHCSFTINPKNGRINATKKSTYSPGMIMYRDENGHVKVHHMSFYDKKEKRADIQFLAENFHFFTPEQITYFYNELFVRSKTDTYGLVVYCGADFEKIKPITEKYIHIITAGIKSKGSQNLFSDILKNWDFEALENTKVPGFDPFVSTGPIDILSMGK